MKQHKSWFDKECLGFLDQKKQAKKQWAQDPSQSNVDNLNNVRRGARRHFKNKKEYVRAKIEELETNSKIINISDCKGGINDFKGYRPRTNIEKEEKDDLVADSHSILTMQRSHFSQLLNIHGVNDVRQTEIHTTEPLVPEPCSLKVELVIPKLNHQVLIKSQQY